MKKRRNKTVVISIVVLLLVAVFISVFLRNNVNLSPTQDACPAITLTQAPSSCFDSDGNNIFNKGYIELKFGLQETPTVTAAAIRNTASSKYWDACSSKSKVCELTCNGKMPKTQVASCPNGYYCNDGKCTQKVCGNNLIEEGEQCDGNNLNGMTCEDFGYLGGNLSCNNNCLGFNTSQCTKCEMGNMNCSAGKLCNYEGKCVLNEPIVPDFKAYELMSVDFDGTEHWQEINLATENIEKGLKIKLDASSTTGPVEYFSWGYGLGCYDHLPTCITYFTYNMTVGLTVYSEDGAQWPSISKPVNVGPAMHKLSNTQPPGHPFQPAQRAVTGNRLWAISYDVESLAFVDISDPSNLGTFVAVRSPGTMHGVLDMTTSVSRVFIIKADRTIDMYGTEPNFTLLSTIPLGELDGSGAYGIAAGENVLYAAIPNNGKIAIFNTSSIIPLLVGTILVDGGTGLVRLAPGNLLVSLSLDGKVNVFNVDNPFVPVSLGSPVQVPSSSRYVLEVNEGILGVRTAQGVALLRFDDYNFASAPQIQLAGPPYVASFALSKNRLYVVDPTDSTGSIYKYDITSRFQDDYLMEQTKTHQVGMYLPFLHDPDGLAGSYPTVLMVGYDLKGYFSETS